MRVSATDTGGLSVADIFELKVEPAAPVNQAPELVLALEDAEGKAGDLFSYTVLEGSFTDADGDALSYAASLADGSPLPAWLSFDAASRSFSGTPPEAGSFSVRVSATDTGGLSAADIFELRVEPQNVISGTPGNDVLKGSQGDDQIHGGDGDDQLFGQDGKDTLSGGVGNDTLYGERGDDMLDGGVGNDLLYGGLGDDQIHGGDGDDQLFGQDGKDQLYGNAGDDTLYGEKDNDTLDGGAGNDLLYGGLGDDALYGGDGKDRLFGQDGKDQLYGNAGDDTLYGEKDNDTLDGGAGNDLLYGGLGDDALFGDAGNDQLFGQDGNDFFEGGAGNDTLSGGTGNDTLLGGAGNDVFVFADALDASTNIDRILDFTPGQDKVHLSLSVFSALGEAGPLGEGLFAANSTGTALDDNDYILYNTTTGALLYDADGSGAGVAVQFATLNNKPEIKENDFFAVS